MLKIKWTEHVCWFLHLRSLNCFWRLFIKFCKENCIKSLQNDWVSVEAWYSIFLKAIEQKSLCLTSCILRYIMITHHGLYARIYKRHWIASMILFCWLLSYGMQLPTFFKVWGKFKCVNVHKWLWIHNQSFWRIQRILFGKLLKRLKTSEWALNSSKTISSSWNIVQTLIASGLSQIARKIFCSPSSFLYFL